MAHGKLLKEYLKNNGVLIESFVDKLSKEKPTSRQTLYNWFEKSEFDNQLIQRIAKTGMVDVKIFEDKLKPTNMNDLKDELIEQLKKRIEEKDKYIELLEGKPREHRKTSSKQG